MIKKFASLTSVSKGIITKIPLFLFKLLKKNIDDIKRKNTYGSQKPGTKTLINDIGYCKLLFKCNEYISLKNRENSKHPSPILKPRHYFLRADN